MSTVATRLPLRLILLQLAASAVTELFIVAFAPRLLLLEPQVLEGSLGLASWVAVFMAGWEIVVTVALTFGLRGALRALSGGLQTISPRAILRLYALPARLTTLDVLAALGVSCAALVPPLRPHGNDLYTQIALVLLTMTMASAAALPLYIMLRVSVARVLELAPPRVAADALVRLDARRASRVKRRILAAVAGPVAFVALGASLLVYAHARAEGAAIRERDAAELARGVLESLGGNEAGRAEAIAVAREHGLRIHVDAQPAKFASEHTEAGETVLTVPLDTGRAVVRFATTRFNPVTWVYVLLAVVASALAGILGARLGAAFGADVALATREVRATGVADVIRGTRVQREARFHSVIALLRAVDELGQVFREFAAAQEKSIVARAAAERMRGLFLASISHDLKGPLNSILGFAELVRRSPLTEGQVESLAIIEQRGRELLTLIQTILDSARVEANELALAYEHTMVGDVVMSAVLEARELAVGSPVEIVGEIQPGVPKLYVDPLRITQALTAVVMTALRFTDKGVVRVLATVPNAESLQIAVESSGRSVPQPELEKIFDAFKFADRARRLGGLGLGLSLARSIVELHGGNVEVGERTGGGVIFRVLLPTEPRPSSRPSRALQ